MAGSKKVSFCYVTVGVTTMPVVSALASIVTRHDERNLTYHALRVQNLVYSTRTSVRGQLVVYTCFFDPVGTQRSYTVSSAERRHVLVSRNIRHLVHARQFRKKHSNVGGTTQVYLPRALE